MIMRPAPEPTTLPKAIREVREQLGLTQSELAERVSVALPSIYRYESGKSVPNPAALKTLCKLAEDVRNERAMSLFGGMLASRLSTSSSKDFESEAQMRRVGAGPEATWNPLLTLGAQAADQSPLDSWGTPLWSVLWAGKTVWSEKRSLLSSESDSARKVTNCLREAGICFEAKLFLASLVMGRKALEMISQEALRTEVSGTFDLKVGLTKLEDAGLIDGRLLGWGTAVADICNRAALHNFEASAEDAWDTLNFALWLWVYTHFLPAELADFDKRRRSAQ